MCGRRGGAIEIGHGKEGVSIIREKAAANRRVATDPDFLRVLRPHAHSGDGSFAYPF